MRGDLPTVLEAAGASWAAFDVADELLRLGLVDARQVYEIASNDPSKPALLLPIGKPPIGRQSVPGCPSSKQMQQICPSPAGGRLTGRAPVSKPWRRF